MTKTKDRNKDREQTAPGHLPK